MCARQDCVLLIIILDCFVKLKVRPCKLDCFK